MKPIKLVISAFGPYVRTMPPIEFDKLEDKGIFLITGKTGAGKTTFFDAICYALYGKASGEFKSEKYFRNENAPISVETFVEFTFSHQGHIYRVKRKPEQERPYRRGEGTTTQGADAELYKDGVKIDLKPSEVAPEITKILKVDLSQFKQIAMIAQGEFWDLINAKTAERTEILRNIFMTHSYNNLGTELKKYADAQKDKNKDIGNSILQDFCYVTADKDDELAERLVLLQDRATSIRKSSKDADATWNIDELICLVQELLESDKEKSEAVKAELEIADKEYEAHKAALVTAEADNKLLEKITGLEGEMTELLKKQEQMEALKELLSRQKTATYEVNPAYQEWHKKAKNITETEKKLTDIKTKQTEAAAKVKSAGEELAKAEESKPEADSLKEVITHITLEEPKYRQREELAKASADIALQKKRIEGEEKKLQEEEAAIKADIEKYTKTKTELGGKPVELEQIKIEDKELESLASDIRKILDDKVKERELQSGQCKKALKDYDASVKAHERALGEYQAKEKIFEGNQLGIIASSLKVGDTCPLCGAEITSESELAKLKDDSVSEAEVKRLKAEAEDLDKKRNAAFTDAEVAKRDLEGFEERLRGEILDCLNNDRIGINADGKTLDELLEILKGAQADVKTKKDECGTRLIEAEKDCKVLLEAEKKLAEATGDRTAKLNEAKDDLIARKTEAEKKASATEELLKSLKELSYPDWKQASEAKAKAEKEHTAITDRIDTAKEAKAAAEKEQVSTETELRTTSETLDTMEKDEKALKDALDKLLGSYGFGTAEAMLGFVVSKEKLNDTEKELTDYDQAVKTNMSLLEQAKKEAEGKTFVDLTALKAQCTVEETAVVQLRARQNEIDNRSKSNNEKLQSILSQKDDLVQSDHDFKMGDKLYKLVSGNIKGGSKISLENYIQGVGFDSIITAANERLKNMTNKQYELIRYTDAEDHSRSYLDLYVIDHETGKKRPVTNISGGESFKAALALALGLSDTVSSSKGGIQMEALFIDEGFGSLDKDSIDSALEILFELSKAHKLVGVISHREELLSLPQKIIVNKTPSDGSDFTVKYGDET